MKNMDRESIMKMESGRKMDELIRNNVTHYVSLTNAMNMDGTFGHLPPYSTDIAAAWEVFQHMKGKLFSKREKYLDELAAIIRYKKQLNIAWPDIMWFVEPVHFCRAALLTVLEDKDHD